MLIDVDSPSPAFLQNYAHSWGFPFDERLTEVPMFITGCPKRDLRFEDGA